MAAALLLVANEHAGRLELPHPGVEQILAATGSSKSRAYELRAALLRLLPGLQRQPGRPPAAPVTPDAGTHEAVAAVTGALLRFVMAHPGCVRAIEGHRHVYRDVFRQRIVELRHEHAGLTPALFARAVHVPLDTLEDWMRAGASKPVAVPAPVQQAADAPDASGGASGAQIETVLAEWSKWHGTFGDFCRHLHEHCRIPFKRTLITDILFTHGERIPARRAGRSPDERALRDAFETFFPNAQWVGDGSPITIELQHQRHTFNLELMMDPHSGAFAGMALTDEEDGAAVVEAVRDARQATGKDPIAVLLDNRPSNHTPEVDAGLGDAMRIRATPGRAQNKAHCEGAFGLFQQTVPALVVNGSDPRGLAHAILLLVVMTFARAVNHRPRRDRDGRSRVELHAEVPTPEQIEQARAALKERCRRQQLARRTLEARQDPAVRELLDRTFARLDLLDPERSVRIAIAGHPLDAIVDGIAIFDGKRAARTLPPTADARYLLGIVRNLAAADEGVHVTEALLRERMEMRDRMLVDLLRCRDGIMREGRPAADVVRDLTNRALDAQRTIDRRFWLLTVADFIVVQPAADQATLVMQLSGHIHATYRLSPHDRSAAVRFVVDRVIDIR